MRYYSNAKGVREACASVLGVPIDSVKMGWDGSGFFLIEPQVELDPELVAAWVPDQSASPPPWAQKAEALSTEDVALARQACAQAMQAASTASTVSALRGAVTSLANSFDALLARLAGE